MCYILLQVNCMANGRREGIGQIGGIRKKKKNRRVGNIRQKNGNVICIVKSKSM